MADPRASETLPVIIYGKRRIREGMEEKFKADYAAFAESVYEENPHVKAIFAFPDHSDPLVSFQVFWSKETSHLVPDSPELDASYESTPDDKDTLEVYGGWNNDTVEASKKSPSVHHNFHKSMAGFIKSDGAAQEGPALFGFTKRHVKPGRMDDLATSFQKLCDIWYQKAGILCATVSLDPVDPNVVHDLRIFANHAAFLSHVDKEDEAMMTAMKTWFENYDTSIPFTGELYTSEASNKDERMHTSSIKPGEVPRAQMITFSFGEGMLGPMPSMTKGDA
jgi:quinol monooxygenase YgiN